MSDPRKVRFSSENEVKPLLPKSAPIPKLKSQTSLLNVEGIKNPLEDLVQCTFCLDTLKEAKMLTCQHTFCLNCLQYNLPSGACDVTCPTCNKITTLQNGFESLEHLPGNMYIDSILKVLSDTNSNTNSNNNCIKCQTVCEFLEHTCQHCKQQFCVNCWSKHLNELTENVKALIDQLNDYDTSVDHLIDTFQDRCIKIEESIRETTEAKIKALQQQEAECMQEVVVIKENEIKSSNEFKLQIRLLQKNITDELNVTSSSDDDATTQKILRFGTLHKNASDIFEAITNWADNKRLVFDATNYKIDRELIDTNGDGEADVEEDEITQSPIVIVNPLENSDTLIEHYKCRRFTPKFTWTKCSRPAHIALAPWNNNCIYIAGTDSRNIYVLDRQKGKLLSRIHDPSMLCPVGLAFSSSELYVTDKWKHCIHVFSKQGNYLKSFGKKGSSSSQLRSPEGIAYHDNRLFICDTGNDRIQVINNTTGAFMYSFGITGAGKAVTGAGFVMDFKYTELNMPTGIAVTEDNRVIVVDSGNRRVKIYTFEGSKIMEFGSLGKIKGQFRSPEVVGVDPLGFIFVGDSGNARVQVFRPNGTLVRVFGNKGKLAWVSGLCVTPQLEVIVSDYKTHTVHIF